MRQLQKYLWAFGLGCLLALVSAYPSWGDASVQDLQTVTWEDLQPSQNTTIERAYEQLPEAQLMEFAELVRRQDDLKLHNRPEDKAEADRLRDRLIRQGVDVDKLREQVDRARAHQWEQATQINPTIDDQLIKIMGYLLPIEQTASNQVSRFLLVPFVGACMHVPPPPPNQVIYVEPETPIDDPGLFAKVWLEGTIRQQPSSHVLFRVDGDQRVDVSYVLDLTAIEPVPYEVIRPETAPNSSSSGPFDWMNRDGNYSWWENIQVKISEMFTTTMTDIQERRSWQALAIGLFVSFGYGVLHTLGPGHGKAVIVSYFVGSGGSLRRGLLMGGRIAVFHVLSSIVIIIVTDLILRQTLASSPLSYLVVRLISYAAIAAIGAWMLWQALRSTSQAAQTASNSINPSSLDPKSSTLTPKTPSINPTANALLYPSLTDQIQAQSTQSTATQDPNPNRLPVWRHLGACSCLACDEDSSTGGWLSLAIGAVPCSGALLILLYGLANNMVWISIAMVLAISFGMAVTLSVIGIAAIWGRNIADRRFAPNSARLEQVTRWVRIAGTGVVCAIGVTLFSVTLLSGLST
jgi:ABC-type nickel/cobalt efflux system permease component RcnA